MELLKLILNVLKFGAIAVGSISGLIGTLTETKDKKSGKPTPWGKGIVSLIVLSGIIAVTTQSIELYLKHQSDIKEEHTRQEASDKTKAILDNASKAATGIDAAITQQNTLLDKIKENVQKTDEVRQNAEKFGIELQEQRESIDKTVTGIGQTAKDLNSVLTAQHQTLTEMYRQTHPIGELQVQLKIEYPIRSGDSGFEDEWLATIRSSAASKISPSVGLARSNSLDPSLDKYPKAFALLKRPRFGIWFNREPSSQLIDKGQDLEFVTQDNPGYINWTVNLDKMVINETIQASTEKVNDVQKVTSLLDLYDAELIIELPDNSPSGSRLISCTLLFPFGTGNGKVIPLTFNDKERREKPFRNVAYVKKLKEVLGSKPDVFK